MCRCSFNQRHLIPCHFSNRTALLPYERLLARRYHPVDVGCSVSQLRTGDRALPSADDSDHQEHCVRDQVERRTWIGLDFLERAREPKACLAQSIPRRIVSVGRFQHTSIYSWLHELSVDMPRQRYPIWLNDGCRHQRLSPVGVFYCSTLRSRSTGVRWAQKTVTVVVASCCHPHFLSTTELIGQSYSHSLGQAPPVTPLRGIAQETVEMR